MKALLTADICNVDIFQRPYLSLLKSLYCTKHLTQQIHYSEVDAQLSMGEAWRVLQSNWKDKRLLSCVRKTKMASHNYTPDRYNI